MGELDFNSSEVVSKQDQEEKDELSTQFDRSISAVQEFTSHFEQSYIRPSFKTYQTFFERRPISAVFLTVFSVLSFLPVITFIGTSLFMIVLFVAVTFGGAFIALAGVILGLFSVLFAVLVVTFFTALVLTAFIIWTYLFIRFTILVCHEGASGISIWANEMKGHIRKIFKREGGSFSHGDQPRTVPNTKAQDADNGRAPEPSDEELYSDSEVKVQGK